MRIGFIATRLSGTDGVSLEVAKWSKVLERMGHTTFYCAGELAGYASGGKLIPMLHFKDKTVQHITQRFFAREVEAVDGNLLNEIHLMSKHIQNLLQNFILKERLDIIIIQNALAIPMHIPLAVSLTELITELGVRTIAHHHDFYWEREQYQTSPFLEFLETYFPPKLPLIRHVTINSIARSRLLQRRDIDSHVIPNVFDFAAPPPSLDLHGQGLRRALNLSVKTPFIIQPTRVIRRKGIEMAIELVSRMNLAEPRLFITHSADDEGLDYWHWLVHESQKMGVSLELLDRLIGDQRGEQGRGKEFSLFDAYMNADLVTYPSLYEGFGNALLEAVYYKRPVVINRYPVYNSDIRPWGFQFIELDGYVDDQAVNQAKRVIQSADSIRETVENNFTIARDHYSLEILENQLKQILESF